MTLHWWDRAACKPYPTDLWFPIGHGGCHGNGDLYDAARTICRRCPVRAECLDAALEEEADVGRNTKLKGAP
jgi:WhiB family redox-sensing transcriptional regulator